MLEADASALERLADADVGRRDTVRLSVASLATGWSLRLRIAPAVPFRLPENLGTGADEWPIPNA